MCGINTSHALLHAPHTLTYACTHSHSPLSSLLSFSFLTLYLFLTEYFHSFAQSAEFATIGGAACGMLLIQYEDGTTNIASCFKVSEQTILTARRNSLPN